MHKEHQYTLKVTWTGNLGEGTTDYRRYERSHTIEAANKTTIQASSDAPFRGDITKHNPEDLLLASLSSCHMLWFLHLCADAGVIVTDYVDNPKGTMIQTPAGGGYFTEVTLYPEVIVTEEPMIAMANSLHQQANEQCFIANSMNFKVRHEPSCTVNQQQP